MAGLCKCSGLHWRNCATRIPAPSRYTSSHVSCTFAHKWYSCKRCVRVARLFWSPLRPLQNDSGEEQENSLEWFVYIASYLTQTIFTWSNHFTANNVFAFAIPKNQAGLLCVSFGWLPKGLEFLRSKTRDTQLCFPLPAVSTFITLCMFWMCNLQQLIREDDQGLQ